MGYREEILDQLYVILEKTSNDWKHYHISAENCKRLLFKFFFRKLSHQKRSFVKRIQYEIRFLENEIKLLGGELSRNIETWEIKNNPILPVFRIEKDGLIKDCYRREVLNITLYHNLLSRISIGQIREMLLFQKHSILLILNEIESMGLRVHKEQNGTEMKYS